MIRISIKELLAQYHPVVPEIQRDYVWGKNKDVLAQFIGDLNKRLGKGDNPKANIGFLYSYPRGNEYYVIDGQQRLTTILLLLHVLSIKTGLHDSFKNIVLPDDTTPAFAYRVRPTSLSFMKMLFKSTATDSHALRNLKDYKLCYDNDLTVQSCLAAVDWLAANLSDYKHLSYDAVLDNVEFWYFNVNRTSQGEELYITMNSRGERLTESEHIKPRLFNKLATATEKRKYGKEWDDWEEFFYRHRNGREIGGVDTAMNNMVRIVVELNTQKIVNQGLSASHADNISLTDISIYMSALAALVEMADKEADKTRSAFIHSEISRLYGDEKDKPEFADAYFNVLKTILTEYLRQAETTFHQIEQVYHLVRNLAVRGMLKSPAEFLSLLAGMKDSEKPFYYFMLDAFTNGRWSSISSDEQECRKIRIFQSSGEAAERQIWEAQETALWRGNIQPLLDWATDGDGYSVTEFNRMHRLLKDFFDENRQEGLTNDDVRRALLTFEMAQYPWMQYDNRAYFGHTADEWRQIILLNSGAFRKFLDEYDKTGETQEEYCQSRISEYPGDKDWSEFVTFPYLLQYINTKHLSYTSDRGWFLEKRSYAEQISVNDEHLSQFLEQHKPEMEKAGYWPGKENSGNDNWVLVTDAIVRVGIWYEQQIEKLEGKDRPTHQCYVIRILKQGCQTPEENQAAFRQFADDFRFISADGRLTLGFEWEPKHKEYRLKVPFPACNDFRGAAEIILQLLEQLFNTPASKNSWK